MIFPPSFLCSTWTRVPRASLILFSISTISWLKIFLDSAPVSSDTARCQNKLARSRLLDDLFVQSLLFFACQQAWKAVVVTSLPGDACASESAAISLPEAWGITSLFRQPHDTTDARAIARGVLILCQRPLGRPGLRSSLWRFSMMASSEAMRESSASRTDDSPARMRRRRVWSRVSALAEMSSTSAASPRRYGACCV